MVLMDRRHDEETAAYRSSSAKVVDTRSPVVGGRGGYPSSKGGGQD